ncbi:MAG: hypothetical protein J6S29_04010 [Methanosphaera sp.]|nr:hypothetical protein [Methanosphaera sp.]
MSHQIVICLSKAKIYEVVGIYKYNENTISTKKVTRFEKSHLNSLPKTESPLTNNRLMLMAHTMMIKRYVIRKNRIILINKKRIYYT